MGEHKVFQMSFAKVYGLLVSKAEKKGRTKAEVNTVACWLTGYSQQELDSMRESDITYGEFFRRVPNPNPSRALIKGVVREARYLDKLVDELAKGKPLEKVLRTPGGNGR